MPNEPKNQAPTLKKGKRKTHSERIMDCLNAGQVLTELDAALQLRCLCLSQRCGDLIRAGVPIQKKWGFNHDTGSRFMTYYLLEQDFGKYTGREV